MRRAAVGSIGMLWALCACQTYSLQELRQVQPAGSEFQKALAREYMLLAEQEEQNYDWQDSWHFADKGLTAAYGNDVGPENVSDWNIPEDKRAELELARDELLSALKPSVVASEPALAARAYRTFDCWVERQEDAWELDKIAECRENFADVLRELRQSVGVGGPEEAVDTTSYIVFFEWNHASLTAAGQRIISKVLDSLAGQENYEIVLNGHTDTTGLERFNLTLSKKRAEVVVAALEKGGVLKETIKIFAFGESDLKVPTPDNVNEPKNRRVEIFIQ
jgi:OOP family OmpA-OmpF porin